MAYNYALKKYANGTLQLTYYNSPMLDSFDKKMLKPDTDKKPLFDDARNYDDALLYTPWGYEADLIDLDEYQEKKSIKILEQILSEDEIKDRKEHSINTALNRSKNKIYDYGRDNVWDWFLTFTLDGNVVNNKSDYIECSKKIRKWFKNVRQRNCPNMKYLIIPEMHKSGDWHFHALLSNVNELTFEIAINNQEYRKDNEGNVILKGGQHVPNKYFGQKLRTSYPDGDYIYNIKEFKSGFTTATKIKDTRKAVSYIVKYVTKDLVEGAFGLRRYYPSNNLTLPERVLGIYDRDKLGDIIQNIEYTYGVKLSTDCMKSIEINLNNYSNVITYMEFNREEP